MAVPFSNLFRKVNPPADLDSSKFEAYVAVYPRSTLVLYSQKTGTPLAALVLRARDAGVLSLLTARPTPLGAADDKGYFQGILNMPNQEFNWTLVNLCNQGAINFNLLRNGKGVNQINVVHANSAILVEADQSTGKSMMLGVLTKKDKVTGAETAKRMEEVEKDDQDKPADEQEALKFDLSVIPQSYFYAENLANKFAEGTVWKSCSTFVRPAPPVLIPKCGFPSSVWRGGEYMARARSCTSGPNVFESRTRSLSRGADVLEFGVAQGASRSRHSRHDDDEVEEEECEEEEGDMGGNAFENDDISPQVAMAMSTPMAMSMPAGASMCELDDKSCVLKGRKRSVEVSGDEDEDEEKAEKKQKGAADGGASTNFAEPVNVGQSLAGKLVYGRDIQVQSVKSDLIFDYDHPSAPASLYMSVVHELKFLPLPDLDAKAREELQDWVQKEGALLLASLVKIFPSETCCIDLESPADTIVATCGHQCINHANIGQIDKCPMCRNAVVSFIRADGVVVR